VSYATSWIAAALRRFGKNISVWFITGRQIFQTIYQQLDYAKDNRLPVLPVTKGTRRLFKSTCLPRQPRHIAGPLPGVMAGGNQTAPSAARFVATLQNFADLRFAAGGHQRQRKSRAKHEVKKKEAGHYSGLSMRTKRLN